MAALIVALLVLVAPLAEAEVSAAASRSRTNSKALRGAAESSGTWFPAGLGLDAVLDAAAKEGDGAPDDQLIHIPGEDVSQDEALPVPRLQQQQPPARRAALVAQRAQAHRSQHFPAAMKRVPKGAVPESEVTDQQWIMPEAEAAEDETPVVRFAPRASAAVAEYDLVADDSQPEVSGILTKGSERATLEDMQRKRSGDFTRKLRQPIKRLLHKQLRAKRILAAPALHRQLSASNATALLTSHVRTPPADRMKAQCLQYAQWMKAQNVQGPTLIKMWTTTCKPIIAAGAATGKMVSMCGNIAGSLANFTNNTLWTPNAVCQAVLAHFVSSGVGASPIAG